MGHVARVLFFAAAVVPALCGQQLREGYADIPGARIFYADSGGTGDAVVFLHAATGAVPMWQYQVEAVTSAGFRFIAYDRRGQGKSTALADAPAGIAAAEDLAALLDHLKIPRAHLVAAAAGGGVAIDFALSYPERARSLTIVCSLGGVVDEDYRRLGKWLRPAPFQSLPAEFIELGPEYRAAHRDGTGRWKQIAMAARPPGAARVPAQPPKNKITLAAMETLRLPVLAIAGGADLYSPPSVMKLFAGRIAGARLVTIPDAGHSAYWESPGRFNEVLIPFLRSVR